MADRSSDAAAPPGLRGTARFAAWIRGTITAGARVILAVTVKGEADRDDDHIVPAVQVSAARARSGSLGVACRLPTMRVVSGVARFVSCRAAVAGPTAPRRRPVPCQTAASTMPRPSMACSTPTGPSMPLQPALPPERLRCLKPPPAPSLRLRRSPRGRHLQTLRSDRS